MENIILHERLHWLWGFVFLGEWGCGEPLKYHPKAQFGNYLSKPAIKTLEDYGLHVNHRRGGDEWWIDYETVQSKINCNLLEARDNYNEAVIEFKAGNVNKAVEKLRSAISPPNYSNVKFIEAYNLLIECIFKLGYDCVDKELLKRVEKFLWWYKRKLSDAVFTIRNVYIKNKIFCETEVEDELAQIEAELEKAEDNYKAISSEVIIHDTARGYEEVVTLIQKLREGMILLEEAQAGGSVSSMEIEEKVCDYPLFQDLKNHRHVKSIIDDAVNYLRDKRPEHADKEDSVDYLLLKIVREGLNLGKNKDLGSLRKTLRKKLMKKIYYS